MHSKLTSLRHYKQLSYALVCNSIFSIDYNTIEQFSSVIKIEEFWRNLKITYKMIDAVITQISQYQFYFDKNSYCNELNLLQFFLCIELQEGINKYQYKYNIFYDTNQKKKTSFQSIDKYLKCFGGGITRGEGNMDFRLLPIEHFEIWLKILEKDYVPNSRTFATYKKMYTTDYNNAKLMRSQYIYENYTLKPNRILYEHKNTILQLSCDAYAIENAELREQIKKLKEYIQESKL